MKLLNKPFTYWLRVIHRDLGFLMVGVCVVYGVSGIFLNHMNGKDPAFRTEEQTVKLSPSMDAQGVETAWKNEKDFPTLKRVIPIDEENLRLILDGGMGVYNVESGITDYEHYTKRPFVYWVNRLHYNRIHGWNVMGDFFAVSLLFFALSGMAMVKGKNGLKGRGKWYLAAGVLIPILYLIFG